MTPEFPASATKTFKFSFPACTNDNVFFNLEVPVEIPHNGCTRELVQRVINMFHIPVYLETELNEALGKFVSEETKSFHNERDEALLNQLKNNEINVDDIVKNWEKEFKDNVMEYAEQKGTSDEEVFAMAYHKLVHSPALETILQVESSYGNTVAETLKNQDDEIKSLTQRQTEEMEEKIAQLNTFATEEDINELVSRHFEEQSLLAGRWGSQLDALWQTQRAQYRAWLMTTLDEYQGSSELNTPSNSPLGVFSSPPPRPPAPPTPRLEESFTIHLGSQLKQTHNLRIVALDLLELCLTDNSSPLEPSSRLQTALGLYSAELSAVVLLAEPGRPGPAPRVGRGAEYHFSAVDAQLSVIGDLLKEPLEQRSALSRATASPDTATRRRGALQPGDIYVTRHSALADAHLLFHLVKDKTVRSGDINSRHPVILGLRNILKTACCNDVTHISLPLLLTHELTDEMTAAWCLRRAELVLKCVKGFMLETAAWGGAELRSVQLATPAGLSREVFLSLAALLPSVFRTPNPLKFNKGS